METVVQTTLRDGSRLAVDLRSATERSAFWTGDYDGAVVRALAERLTRDAVVLDVGANIGFYTVPLARSGATVVAFEPMPANFRRLVENVVANGVRGRVTAVQTALGDETGRLELAPEPGAAPTGNAAPAAPGAANAVSVELRPLDDLAVELGIERCDLVKIDVEGGELSVLRGGERFLRRRRPPVFAELNRYWMEAAGWTEEDLLALASAWGYAAFGWDGRRFVTRAAAPRAVDNVLLVPR